MGNELQNEDFYLKGDLGTVKIGSAIHEVTKVFKGNDGATTMTITPFPTALVITCNDDCFFDAAKIDNRLKELGALEDIDCEIVTPKQIENGSSGGDKNTK